LGLDVLKGVHSTIGGIVPGARIDVYYHDVSLWVGTGMIRIRAGFALQITAAALLGRHGFFEHYIVKFDPSAEPPGFDIERLGRA
jgi:hypothetical protein